MKEIFFQCRNFFRQLFPCENFFPLKSVCRIFFSEVTHTVIPPPPSKVKWSVTYQGFVKRSFPTLGQIA